MSSLQWFSVLVIVGTCSSQESSPLPVTINTTVISGSNGCPTQQVRDDQLDLLRNQVLDLLENTVTPHLDGNSTCPCGGAGEWSKIASLDMTDPNQQCPSTWRLNTFSGIRGCGRTTSACDSVSYPSNGRTYSRVCGKIIAYQQGGTDAFNRALYGDGLESAYVDGISLTHGAPGSRSHIWTFAVALNDFGSDGSVCPCSNTSPWPYTVPSFTGNNYFCDTGDHDAGQVAGRYYPDEPLFDGQGCGPDSTCCQFNTPPWFCTELPQPTNDDLEIRICSNVPISREDVVISMIDIYIL